jgi:hypothetical protein
MVLTNNGSGRFRTNATYTVGSGPVGVVAVDVNGDNKVDLVSANYTDSSLTVLTNNGSGGFGLNVTYYLQLSNPQGLAAADLTGDGKQDLITPNLGTADLTLMLTSGTPSPLFDIQPVSRTNALVHWPGYQLGYGLQQNTSLTAGNWTPMTNAISLVNGGNPLILFNSTNEASITTTSGSRFLRLYH